MERKDFVEWGHDGHNESWDMLTMMLTAASNRASTPDIKGFLGIRGLKTKGPVPGQPQASSSLCSVISAHQ